MLTNQSCLERRGRGEWRGEERRMGGVGREEGRGRWGERSFGALIPALRVF